MGVYIDKLRTCLMSKQWRWPKSCHLYADTVEELHEFAQRIGMKRAWFQSNPRLPHYDLNESRRAIAVKAGAIEVTDRQIVDFMHARRDERVKAAQTESNSPPTEPHHG